MENYIDTNGHSNMNLKHWLIYQLNDSNFQEHGIEWIEKNHGTFRIIWVEKDKPGWIPFIRLLKAWALNKDGEEKSQSETQLRARFRDALRNSNYFAFVRDEQLQSRSYKVYKLLTKDEIKAKKERLKKKSSTDASDQSPISSQDSPDLDLDELLQQVTLTGSQTLEVFNDGSVSAHNLNGHQDNQIQSPSEEDLMLKAMAQSGVQPFPNSEQMETDLYCNGDSAPADPVVAVPNVHPEFQFQTVEQILSFASFTAEDFKDLTKFEVTIHYEKEAVFKGVVDLSAGCFVSIQGQQVESKFSEYMLPPFDFPQYSGDNPLAAKVLEGIAGGFALQSSANYDYNLVALRRSKFHIFFINSENDEELVKLERNAQTSIFSYVQYVLDTLDYNAGINKRRPCSKVMVVFGHRPKSALSNILISLTLKPFLSEKINQGLGYSENSLSLLFSDEQFQTSFRQNVQKINSAQPQFHVY